MRQTRGSGPDRSHRLEAGWWPRLDLPEAAGLTGAFSARRILSGRSRHFIIDLYMITRTLQRVVLD